MYELTHRHLCFGAIVAASLCLYSCKSTPSVRSDASLAKQRKEVVLVKPTHAPVEDVLDEHLPALSADTSKASLLGMIRGQDRYDVHGELVYAELDGEAPAELVVSIQKTRVMGDVEEPEEFLQYHVFSFADGSEKGKLLGSLYSAAEDKESEHRFSVASKVEPVDLDGDGTQELLLLNQGQALSLFGLVRDSQSAEPALRDLIWQTRDKAEHVLFELDGEPAIFAIPSELESLYNKPEPLYVYTQDAETKFYHPRPFTPPDAGWSEAFALNLLASEQFSYPKLGALASHYRAHEIEFTAAVFEQLYHMESAITDSVQRAQYVAHAPFESATALDKLCHEALSATEQQLLNYVDESADVVRLEFLSCLKASLAYAGSPATRQRILDAAPLMHHVYVDSAPWSWGLYALVGIVLVKHGEMAPFLAYAQNVPGANARKPVTIGRTTSYNNDDSRFCFKLAENFSPRFYSREVSDKILERYSTLIKDALVASTDKVSKNDVYFHHDGNVNFLYCAQEDLVEVIVPDYVKYHMEVASKDAQHKQETEILQRFFPHDALVDKVGEHHLWGWVIFILLEQIYPERAAQPHMGLEKTTYEQMMQDALLKRFFPKPFSGFVFAVRPEQDYTSVARKILYAPEYAMPGAGMVDELVLFKYISSVGVDEILAYWDHIRTYPAKQSQLYELGLIYSIEQSSIASDSPVWKELRTRALDYIDTQRSEPSRFIHWLNVSWPYEGSPRGETLRKEMLDEAWKVLRNEHTSMYQRERMISLIIQHDPDVLGRIKSMQATSDTPVYYAFNLVDTLAYESVEHVPMFLLEDMFEYNTTSSLNPAVLRRVYRDESAREVMRKALESSSLNDFSKDNVTCNDFAEYVLLSMLFESSDWQVTLAQAEKKDGCTGPQHITYLVLDKLNTMVSYLDSEDALERQRVLADLYMEHPDRLVRESARRYKKSITREESVARAFFKARLNIIK